MDAPKGHITINTNFRDLCQGSDTLSRGFPDGKQINCQRVQELEISQKGRNDIIPNALSPTRDIDAEKAHQAVQLRFYK